MTNDNDIGPPTRGNADTGHTSNGEDPGAPELGPLQKEHDYDKPVLSVSRWAVPLGIIVVVVALVVIALSRGITVYDPTSPEGAVQEYLIAVSEERWNDAIAVLDPETFEDCDLSDIRDYATGPFTASHLSTREGAFHTYVDVRIRVGDGGLFGSSWETHPEFALIERDRHWYLTNDPWPYFTHHCDWFR